MEARLPTTMTMSLALHGGALFGWLYLNQVSHQNANIKIEDVQLLINKTVVQPVPNPVKAPPRRMPVSTFDLLKMALPSVPRTHEGPLEVKTHEALEKKPLMDIRKIQDKGRMNKVAQLQPLDLERNRSRLAAIDAKIDASHHSAGAIAEMAPLAEVGRRRASKAAIEMDALREEHGRLQAMGVPSQIDAGSPRHAGAIGPMLPAEAQSSAGSGSRLNKFASMLTSDVPPVSQGRQMMVVPKRVEMTEATPKRRAESLQGRKKGVEITGPLKNRKVAYYELPEFPSWAAAQGILEAEVQIRFYVSPAGGVIGDNMTVVQTSGYGRIDRLAMDFLKRWRFQPVSDDTGRQWGIITFRFVSE